MILKDCPFCGMKADTDIVDNDDSTMAIVYCTHCYQTVTEDDMHNAIGVWNNRPLESKAFKDGLTSASMLAQTHNPELAKDILNLYKVDFNG